MKYTFKQFQTEFPDDAACLAAVMKAKYGGTRLVCPACKAEVTFHAMTARRAYACQECGHHIYPCAGTIFHKSSTKLTHWFFAMYLMTSTRHGVAAKELQRQIGCTYKTAWRLAHELRKLMAVADYKGPLSGHVEIDETLVGGVQRGPMKGKGKRGKANKFTVMGMVAREGALRAGPIKDIRRKTLEPFIRKNILPGSTISTDELRSYRSLYASPYRHGVVNHAKEEWVRGIHHTNTIEGHWSLLKRAIRGTHVHVSGKHLWKYVSEFSYRRNFRHCHATMFNRLVSAVSLPRLAVS
ncbi:MAG: IS1595 family transposase [Alphaproteobacteria bacterium]